MIRYLLHTWGTRARSFTSLAKFKCSTCSCWQDNDAKANIYRDVTFCDYSLWFTIFQHVFKMSIISAHDSLNRARHSSITDVSKMRCSVLCQAFSSCLNLLRSVRWHGVNWRQRHFFYSSFFCSSVQTAKVLKKKTANVFLKFTVSVLRATLKIQINKHEK